VQRPKENTLSNIISMLKNKEEKGLSLLYDQYAPTLLGIITNIVRNKNLGEEILQVSMLKVWNNIESYDPDKGNFFAWIAQIARNSALDQVRLKGYQNRQNTDSMDQVNPPVIATLMPTDSIDANVLLSRLETKHKEVLNLIYLQGYTQSDTAKALDIPLGTVKTRLRMAIQTLRTDLKGEEKLFYGLFLLFTILMLLVWI